MSILSINNHVFGGDEIVYLEPFLPAKNPDAYAQDPFVFTRIVLVDGTEVLTRTFTVSQICMDHRFPMLFPDLHIGLNPGARLKKGTRFQVKPIEMEVYDKVTGKRLLSRLCWRDRRGLYHSKRMPASKEQVELTLTGRPRNLTPRPARLLAPAA
jgi:hypothetical protein